MLTLLCYLPTAQRKCCLFRTHFKTLFTESERTSGLMSRAMVTPPAGWCCHGAGAGWHCPAASYKEPLSTVRRNAQTVGGKTVARAAVVSFLTPVSLPGCPQFLSGGCPLPPGSFLPTPRLQIHNLASRPGLEAELQHWVSAFGRVISPWRFSFLLFSGPVLSDCTYLICLRTK